MLTSKLPKLAEDEEINELLGQKQCALAFFTTPTLKARWNAVCQVRQHCKCALH